jgi:hypothetical protein
MRTSTFTSSTVRRSGPLRRSSNRRSSARILPIGSRGLRAAVSNRLHGVFGKTVLNMPSVPIIFLNLRSSHRFGSNRRMGTGTPEGSRRSECTTLITACFFASVCTLYFFCRSHTLDGFASYPRVPRVLPGQAAGFQDAACSSIEVCMLMTRDRRRTAKYFSRLSYLTSADTQSGYEERRCWGIPRIGSRMPISNNCRFFWRS